MRALIVLLLLGTAAALPAFTSVLQLSDIHYDPLYVVGAPVSNQCRATATARSGTRQAARSAPGVDAGAAGIYGQAQCDTPYALLTNVANAAAHVGASAGAVLITGDMAAHNMDNGGQVLQAIANATATLNAAFDREVAAQGLSQKPVFLPCLGNDDAFPNYGFELPPNQWLNDVADIYYAAGWFDNDTHHQFVTNGGYYSVSVNTSDFYVLNTVYWSPSWTGANGPFQDDPAGQFAWLRAGVYNSTKMNRNVFIVGHIPPGFDTYVTDTVPYVPLWQQPYIDTYMSIIDSGSAHLILAEIFGHTHRDTFRLYVGDCVRPFTVCGSISPIYANNPNFRQYSYSGFQGRLYPTDYTQYYLDLQSYSNGSVAELPLWRIEYNFTAAYSNPPSDTGLFFLYPDIFNKTGYTTDYYARTTALYYTPPMPQDSPFGDFVCPITAFSADKYTACVQNGINPLTPSTTTTTTATSTTGAHETGTGTSHDAITTTSTTSGAAPAPSSNKAGLIVGSVIGGLAIVGLVAGGVIFARRRRAAGYASIAAGAR